MRVTCLTYFLCLCLLWGLPKNSEADASPEVTIATIQKAIDTSDVTLFIRHVDIDGLLNQGVSSLIEGLRSAPSLQTKGLPPVLALMLASVQTPELAETTQKLLVREGKDFVRYGVESGMFAGSPKADVVPSGLLAPFLQNLSTGRKELRIRGKTRRVPSLASSMAIIPITVYDAGNGKNYKVDLQLEQKNGIWKVSQIANMDKLISRLKKEAAEQ